MGEGRARSCGAHSHIPVIEKMKLTLIGAKVGGGLRNTNKLKILNFKKAIRCSNDDKLLKKPKTRKCDLTSTMN